MDLPPYLVRKVDKEGLAPYLVGRVGKGGLAPYSNNIFIQTNTISIQYTHAPEIVHLPDTGKAPHLVYDESRQGALR